MPVKRFFILFLISSCGMFSVAQDLTISRQVLQDKIKGGWAGQTIGVTFGGPYEFRYQGSFINDYQKLTWYNGYLAKTMTGNPGLYDDLYMDITFVEIFEKYGLDAPVDSFANAYARAEYPLWHANQAGRYNLLHGIKAPASGYWKNNPHADCIDYQIESDFAGLMCPAMPNTASRISDKVGHIMNYGDGWYGGVFTGAMYTLAFVSDNIPEIISSALATIPERSEFHECIRDVVEWHKKYPADWKQNWMEVQKKWANDIGCPDGVFSPFNIDAKVNAAYVVIGLLYGNGDFTKTLEITTRCGQDADCNPSTAGGILGAMIGYENIPAYWKQGLKEAEDIPFKYTSMSLNKVYDASFRQALENIRKHGGKTEGDRITIKSEKPVAVDFEKSFDGIYPVAQNDLEWNDKQDSCSMSFEGVGFVIKGDVSDWENRTADVVPCKMSIDGGKPVTIDLPVNFLARRHEIAWTYDLPRGAHKVVLAFPKARPDLAQRIRTALVYDRAPSK